MFPGVTDEDYKEKLSDAQIARHGGVDRRLVVEVKRNGAALGSRSGRQVSTAASTSAPRW